MIKVAWTFGAMDDERLPKKLLFSNCKRREHSMVLRRDGGCDLPGIGIDDE